MASLQTIKEGPMNKKGKIHKEWRQRQFVLNGKRLSYFKGGKHAPSGMIELKDIRNISDILADGTFSIETPTRIYEVRGDSRQETQEWIDAIREALSELQSS